MFNDLKDCLEEVIRRLGRNRAKYILEGDASKQFVASCRKLVNKNPEIKSGVIHEAGEGRRIDVAERILQEDFEFLDSFLKDRYNILDDVGSRNFFRVVVESVRDRPELHHNSFEEIISGLVDSYEEEVYFS